MSKQENDSAKKAKKKNNQPNEEVKIVEHVEQEDLYNNFGYSPEVDVDFDKIQEAINASYSGEELVELFGEPTKKDANTDETSMIQEAIVGSDNRDLETSNRFPFSAICQLFMTSKNGYTYKGTGFMISPRVVVTAGHCVYFHNDGGWAKSIEVIPRMNGTQKPYGSASSGYLATYSSWINNKDTNYDIGIIILPKNNRLGNKTGWWGFGYRGSQYYKGTPITTAGYPGDKPQGEMWRMSGNDTSLVNNDMKMKYTIDTMGGQSGSPVWEVVDGKYIVLGVHTNGCYGTNGKGEYNLATRIDKTKFDWLSGYKTKDLEDSL